MLNIIVHSFIDSFHWYLLITYHVQVLLKIVEIQ